MNKVNDEYNESDESETPSKRHWCGYEGQCGEEDCVCCEYYPENECEVYIRLID